MDEGDVETVEICGTCSTPLKVDCPCGARGCRVRTRVHACPTCKPQEFAREIRFTGVAVCETVLERYTDEYRRA